MVLIFRLYWDADWFTFIFLKGPSYKSVLREIKKRESSKVAAVESEGNEDDEDHEEDSEPLLDH
jgi:hypothetical protein